MAPAPLTWRLGILSSFAKGIFPPEFYTVEDANGDYHVFYARVFVTPTYVKTIIASDLSIFKVRILSPRLALLLRDNRECPQAEQDKLNDICRLLVQKL
jgi:hypothetical protein